MDHLIHRLRQAHEVLLVHEVLIVQLRLADQ